MADEKLSQLPTGTAIVDADLSYWDQSSTSVKQPASAISTYANSKLPVGSAAQKGIVEVDGTTITAASGVISASGGVTLAGGNLTFFVATTGSDSNPGTSGSPFLTLNRALQQVAKFDYAGAFNWTINIADGTYPETGGFRMPQITRPITQGGFIHGNATTPANVVFSNSGGFINAPATYEVGLGGFKQLMAIVSAPAFLVGMGANTAGNEGGFVFTADFIIGEVTPGTYIGSCFVAGGGALIDVNGLNNVTFTITQAINIIFTESGGIVDFDGGDANFIFPVSFTILNAFILMQGASQVAWIPLSITNNPGGGVEGGGASLLTTANGLVTDVPGSVYFVDSPFFVKSLAGGDTSNIVTAPNAGQLTAALVPNGTWGTYKDTTNGPRQIVMTDGSVTYTTQIGNFINTQTGTTYTLALFDQEGIVEMNNASSNTLTVPTNAAVAFPIGTKISVVQQGAGATTIAAAGGVTIHSAGALTGQFKPALLYKRGTDEWTQINGAF